jgi:phytoene dehydrogenase-like protein
MSSLRDHYDVICAGGGLSSYLCAALLARTGKRVLVIDEDPATLAHATGESGAIFDPDFAVFNGLGPNAALGKSLRELGLSADGNDFVSADAVTQVLSPEYRIIFWNNLEQAQKEMRRELNGTAEAVSSFFSLLYQASEQIPSFVENVLTSGQSTSSDLSRWRRYWGRYYSSIMRHRPIALRETLPSAASGIGADLCSSLSAALLGTSSYCAPTNLGCEQAIRGLCMMIHGRHYYRGGFESLRLQLTRLIRDAGGMVRLGATVESLVSESSKVTGVLLSSFEGIIRGDVVVLSRRLKRLYQTLPNEVRDGGVLRSLNRIQPASWRFTLSVGVERDAIPIGATSSMTYVGSYKYPLEEENYLRIQVLPDELYPREESTGKATLLVTAFVPYRASSIDYGHLRRLGGRMMRTLTELMPFLEGRIVGIYPDIRKGEEELAKVYPFEGPDWVPENLIQYYVRGERGVQDFWGPSWTTPHRNLYFGGRSIWPALGIYGEALTARKIFEDVMLPGSGGQP